MRIRLLLLTAASTVFTTASHANPLGIPTSCIGAAAQQARDMAFDAFDAKVAGIDKLQTNANAISKKVDAIRADGNLATSTETIHILQDLIKQLKATNDALQKVQSDVQGIFDWIEAQKKPTTAVTADVKRLSRVTQRNYIQFQWQDTQSDPAVSTPRNDGFQVRRFRLSQTNKLDDKFSAKLSFDVAAGTNRLSAELKDAQLVYDVRPSMEQFGTQVVLGQQPLPLGYEIERSSADREFPERALYNTRLFAGERDRGVNFKHGVGNGLMLHAGIWNGTTIGDPQLTGANTFRDLDNKIAFTMGARMKQKNYDVGVSALVGDRPGFTPTGGGLLVPDVRREILVLDGMLMGFLGESLTLRAEYLIGKDRDPIGGTMNPTFRQRTNVMGWQSQLSYAITARNAISVRYHFYDPDTSDATSTNNNVATWGVAFAHWFNPGFKVTVSYENPNEQGTHRRDSVWTVRGQFRL